MGANEIREQIIGMIPKFAREHGYMPSSYDIAEELGIEKFTIVYFLKKMIDDGTLPSESFIRGNPRAYRLEGYKMEVFPVDASTIKPKSLSDVYIAIANFINKYGYAPTSAEIENDTFYAQGTIVEALRNLRRRGLIVTDKKTILNRAYTLPKYEYRKVS